MAEERRAQVSASIDINASAHDTWTVVTDWAAQGDWIPMTSVALDETSPIGLGARLVARTGVGRVAIVDPMVVDVWQPPHRCEVAHQGRIVSGRGVFVVEELPGGRSRFTWQEIPVHGARGAIERLGAPFTRRALAIAARRLARLVETARPT